MIVGIVRKTDGETHSLEFELAQDQYLAPNVPRYRMDWPKALPLPAADSQLEIVGSPAAQS